MMGWEMSGGHEVGGSEGQQSTNLMTRNRV